MQAANLVCTRALRGLGRERQPGWKVAVLPRPGAEKPPRIQNDSGYRSDCNGLTLSKMRTDANESVTKIQGARRALPWRAPSESAARSRPSHKSP
jgi:hypothetical protein